MTIQESVIALREEENALETQLTGLLPKHANKFVVFKDGSVVSIHATYSEAFAAAVERFGPETLVLITQIKPRAFEGVSVSWTAGAMFAEEPKKQAN